MTAKRLGSEGAIDLWVADTFWRRLRGMYGLQALGEHQGVLIVPCRAIHTFFLRRSIDVVFLDSRGRVCRCLHAVAPNRIAWHAKAAMVVELPAGYCRRYPDYAARIHAALQLRVFPRLPE